MTSTSRTSPTTSQTSQSKPASQGTSMWGSSADPLADSLQTQDQLQDSLLDPQSAPDQGLGAAEGGITEEPTPKQTVRPVASPDELFARISRIQGLIDLDQSIAFSEEDISQISGDLGYLQKLMGAALIAGDPPPLQGRAQEIPTPLVAGTVTIAAPAILAILEWIALVIASITLVEVLVVVAVVLLIVAIVVAIERALERRASPEVDVSPEPEVHPGTETEPEPQPAPRLDDRARPNDRVQPIPVAPERPRSKWHRGNIHVQGDDIGSSAVPNFPWMQPVPMAKGEALAGLALLKGQLSKRQLTLRDQAFVKAAKFIATTLAEAPPLVFKTFQNPNLIGDKDRTRRTARVDIEIIQGVAFV